MTDKLYYGIVGPLLFLIAGLHVGLCVTNDYQFLDIAWLVISLVFGLLVARKAYNESE